MFEEGSLMHRSLPIRDPEESSDNLSDTPRHGFQGDRGAVATPSDVPAALSVALSRESGARGGTIGRRAGRKLGWQVYDQELLEYMAQDTVVRQGLFDGLLPSQSAWVDARLEELLRQQDLSQHPSIVNMARVMLSLGSQGGVVLIGRGAGYILPRSVMLHVRVIAPMEDRIAFMSQWLRLTVAEATERVHLRDQRRAEFISTHFHRKPEDAHQFDLILNSSQLGEDLCAELITQAAKGQAARR
jgi:cytidylate kinase